MKKIFLIIMFAFTLLAFANIVSAHCPLCTAGAGASIGIARYLGVDDSIVGLFLGAFIASTALWFNNFLKKKKIQFALLPVVLVIASFFMMVVPLYLAGIITDFEMVRSMPEHHSMLGMGVYGIDKLLLGIILGTLLISGTFGFSDFIKEKKGRRLFAYQGLVFMLITLGVFSLILWLLK